jgi:N-acetylmuramoyl-L-alanine amidase
MKKLLIIAGIFLSQISFAQMPIYGADSMQKHYQAKLDELLIGDSSLYKLVRIDIYGVHMLDPAPYLSAGDLNRVSWQELSIYKNVVALEPRENAMQIMLEKGNRNFSPTIQKQYGQGLISKAAASFRPPLKPLAGMKIALDPGHVANDTALGHIEQKFISMNVPAQSFDTRDSVPVAFAEGQLTWQTAAILAEKLRNAGAEVILTRPGAGITAFGKTFEQWKEDDYLRTLDSLLIVDPRNQNLLDLKSGKMKTDRSIFRFVFRDAELRKRSEIINAFDPDLTVVIHYNVDEANAPWSHPSTKNYCMLFVPGSFEAGELNTPEERYDFLRLLLTDDLEQSIEASNLVGIQFKKILDVPLASESDASYLSTSCKAVYRQGVFARNLSMTRLIQSPVVYGETLYQDNRYEAKKLSDRSLTDSLTQLKTSKRVMEVADAYYEGILSWSFLK